MHRRRLSYLRSSSVCVGICSLLLASGARAASTGSTALLTPQGSGAGTANGDWVSSGITNGVYRYWVEVPASLSRLRIQLFDADVGLGGAGEAAAGRDRFRTTPSTTTATYTLIDPAGTQRTTRFITGSLTAPTGADNAWLDFYNATGTTFLDQFGTAAYTNNNGNTNWATNWIETDAGGGGATGGSVLITGGVLRVSDGATGDQSIEREANLSSPGMQSAFLTFSYTTSGNLEASDGLIVQVSSNGGGAWTTL
ncbi:MAG TPA: hypothetical protein VGV61_18445, partial [Thermoanaerobaculia bacterium]|nr:hypothetical protein [Thermoanaerobaculia bacterium]